MKKIIALLLVLVISAFALVSCQKAPPKHEDLDLSAASIADFEETTKRTDYVLIKVKDYGEILVRLFPDVAPESVKNFKKLVSENFYDGIIFHRVINGFMFQGGDPEGTGMGGSAENIKGEFASNGVANPLSHTAGVVSMARRGNDNNSASSQFFIMHKTATHLDGDYAAFGKVWRGIETVNQIASVPTDGSDKPLTPVVIKTISFVEIPA